MYLKRALSQFNHLSLGERWAMGQKWSLQIFLNWKKCTRRKRRKTDTKNRASLYFCTAKVCCVYCSVFHKNKPLWVKVSSVDKCVILNLQSISARNIFPRHSNTCLCPRLFAGFASPASAHPEHQTEEGSLALRSWWRRERTLLQERIFSLYLSD